jgi:hypothetical protein
MQGLGGAFVGQPGREVRDPLSLRVGFRTSTFRARRMSSIAASGFWPAAINIAAAIIANRPIP